MEANLNSTISAKLPPLPECTLVPRPSILPGISDIFLQLLLPVVAYWAVSMFFHFLDTYDLFPQYRLHTPAELLKRNHVTRYEVVRDVIIQQIIQTATGLLFAALDPIEMTGMEDCDVAAWATRIRIAERFIPQALAAVGIDSVSWAKNLVKSFPSSAGALAGGHFPNEIEAPRFQGWELLAAKAIYWILIPAVQFTIAIFIVDTWEYFLHRAMHMNKWLYTTLHSRHHRLYVPYAFGALYNHPVEGFILDTAGTGIAYLATGMSVRQGMWFFTCSTIKTVDDHCGYAFPWDPLQHITSNNAAYHDIHHQSWGVKSNFSQPFFTFWDHVLGTVWTGGDVSARYERSRIAAQKKIDAVATSIDSPVTNSPAIGMKALQQLDDSRRQVIEDENEGGPQILQQEAAGERNTIKEMKRNPRKKSGGFENKGDGFKSLRERVAGGLHRRGRSTAILHADGAH